MKCFTDPSRFFMAARRRERLGRDREHRQVAARGFGDEWLLVERQYPQAVTLQQACKRHGNRRREKARLRFVAKRLAVRCRRNPRAISPSSCLRRKERLRRGGRAPRARETAP